MSAPQKYALLFIEGERVGEAYPLEVNEVSLGRSRANQITIGDELLSRNHIVFRRQGDDIVVEDLDSAHGSFLNDKRLRGILSLQVGDVVQVGSQKIKLVTQEEVASHAEQTMRELDAIDRAAAAAEAEEALDKTRFGAEEDLDETRFQAAPVQMRDDEDEDVKTRVLEDQATRMLDLDELQGLKPAKTVSGPRKMVLGVVLMVALLAAAAFGIVKWMGGAEADADAVTNYEDDQYAFGLAYPAVWQKTGTDADATISFELFGDGGKLAHGRVYADQSLSHESSGLSVGFQDYIETLKTRHPGFRLKGSKTLDLNGIRMIQFGFASDDLQGIGIFTYSGPTRYVVEAAATTAEYYNRREQLVGLLESFRLTEPQVVIDFPLPDDAIRRMALGRTDELIALAEAEMKLGQDLMRVREVRTDNLWRAADKYRSALQMASALTTPPPFYDTAVRELGDAIQLLNRQIQDQKFKITRAEKIGDYETARWELSKLMQMVPDKNDPVYREAKENLKWYEAYGY